MLKNQNHINSILYVEDEKAVQDELAEFLEIFCDTVYTADNGSEGFELFKKQQPDIVITDIKMPVMDGIDMCKKIKAISENTPIVFTTAFSDVEYFQEAIELQVEGYILKPISLESLEKKIQTIIATLGLKRDLEEKEQMLIQTSKLAAMGEMIGNIAHQWRQPLSVISTSATGMKLQKSIGELSTEEFEKSCDLINDNVQYLSQTIEDFRNFFQPSALNESFDLKEYLNRCVDLLSASFKTNMIQTIKEIDDKVNLFGDPNQLIQALINILNNAKDALNSASQLREKLVFIFTVKEVDNKNIVITIKDNAGGIPEEIISRVFEPYFSTKDKNQGTGLGLYITHTIITRNLQGTIKVENEIFEHENSKYQGAKFTITLPLLS